MKYPINTNCHMHKTDEHGAHFEETTFKTATFKIMFNSKFERNLHKYIANIIKIFKND